MTPLRTPAPDRKPSPRRATGSDVARLAGVSKSAVSRAYTGGVVSEDARARILDAAAMLKFRPSHAARSLATNRSHLIGVAVTYLDNQFYPEVIQALSDALAAIGYRVVLFVTHGEDNLDPVLDEILSYHVDAVVFASSSRSARVALECQAAGVPVVMFNSIDPDGRVKSVAAAGDFGARTAAAFLVAGGHARYAVIAGLDESSTSVERCTAFSDEILRAGFAAPAIAPGRFTFGGAVEATRALLARAQPPDAIFCANDHMAFAAVQTARGEFALTPGRDVSIIGFDNVAIAAWSAFDLTTYAQPIAAMVERIVDYLVRAMDGRAADEGLAAVKGDLIVRGSTRPAPGIVTDANGRRIWRRPPT